MVPILFKVIWGVCGVTQKHTFQPFLSKNKIHLLGVSADVWVGADSAAVELVLAAGPKELEIKRLVIVANI